MLPFALRALFGRPGPERSARRTPRRGHRPTFEALEDRLVPSATKIFGGLEFQTAGTFTTANHTVTATGPVRVGVNPAPGAAFTPLLSLDGGVQFNDADPTGTFTTPGAVSGITATHNIPLLDAHTHVFRAADLLSGFDALPSTDTNLTRVPVAGDSLAVTGLHLAGQELDLHGSLSLPQLAGFSLPIQGVNSVALDRAGTHLGGFDLNDPGTTSVSAGGLTVTLQSPHIHYSPAANEFDLSGAAGVALLGNPLALSLGTPQTPGLVIAHGNLQSLHASITTPRFTVGGLTFQSSGLTFDYDRAHSGYAITGSSSITFSGHTVGLALGDANTAGLVIQHGALTSLDATVLASAIDFGTAARITKPNLTLHYQASPEAFFITGGATLQLAGSDRELAVQLGDASTRGIVIQNGQLTGLDLSVRNNSPFTVGGLTINPRSLHVTYNQTHDAAGAHQTFTLTGDVAFSAGTALRDVEISLGDDVRRTGGLVITDGVLESLNAAVTSDFTVAGLHVTTDHLTFAYDRSHGAFSLYGSLSVSLAGQTFAATLGDAVTPGLVISNGQLQSLNITKVNGDFNLFALDVTAKDISIQYNAALHRLELAGGLGVHLLDSLGGAGASATLSQGGLVIDTQTGALSIDATHGLHLTDVSFTLGQYAVKDGDIAYSRDAAGRINLSGSCTVVLSQFSVNGSFQIQGGKLKEIGLGYNKPIPIGASGWLIDGISGKIDNLNDVQHLLVEVSATVTYGKQITIAGTNYNLLSITGDMALSPTEFDISAKDVEVGGGHLATGTGTLAVKWDPAGHFQSVSGTVNLSVLQGLFPYSGRMEVDSAGNFTIDGTASVALPNYTPGYIRQVVETFNNGSDTLAAARVHFQLRPGQDASQNYASALLVVSGTPVIGIKVDFNKSVTLIGGSVEAVTGALRKVGATAAQIAQTLKDGFGKGAREVAQFLHDHGIDPAQIGSALQSAFGATAGQVAGYLHQVTQQYPAVLFGVRYVYTAAAYTYGQIATALKDGLGQQADAVVSALKNALGATADQVARAVSSAFGDLTPLAVGRLLYGAGFAADQVAGVLKNTFGSSALAVSRFFTSFVPLAITDAVRAVQSAFALDVTAWPSILGHLGYEAPETVGRVLYGAGFTAGQVAGVLKNTFGMVNLLQITDFFMNTLNLGLDEAVRAVQSAFGLSVAGWGTVLEELGYGPAQIASAFRNGLNATVSEVYNWFHDVQGTADQDIANLLQGAGYAANQVKDFFTNLGDSIAGWFKSTFHIG